VAVYFLDSSALVKRYAQETGSAWVEMLTDGPCTWPLRINTAGLPIDYYKNKKV
jgi:hypothetical protein